MFIQEIIIDGFKSYAKRTVIDGFDPHFNAITGLNGSGKSNILDAICFVLGISNLSQVRAGNLSELVYKQGQAGVNKATVTVVFNNQDEASCPVGYESSDCPQVTVTRQVLIGGKSKYLINGRTAQAAQVQNLFHSVSLNVNNPHFLIMQGRITKVLNMKPHEILGMVEEAAGTRMYETKRVAALKTIEKKQTKLDELNVVLSEDITPTLERLRGEKQSYLQWSKNNADIGRIERFVVAAEFLQALSVVNADKQGSAELQVKVEQLQAQATLQKEALGTKEEEIAQRASQLRGDLDEQLNEAKEREQTVCRQVVKITSAWKNSQETVEKAESDLDAARTLLTETKQAVLEKQESMTAVEADSIETRRHEAKAAEDLVAQLAADYQAMSAGIATSSTGGHDADNEALVAGTLLLLPEEQISKAHSDSKKAEAKAQQAKMKIEHLSKQLKTVEKDLQKERKSADKLADQRDMATRKVADLKEQIQQLGFSATEYNALDDEKRALEMAVAELTERVDTLSAQLQGRLAFKYSDPVRGFDRSKVKGLIAKLILVRDQKHATALEVVAGGKLYQVVVDEAITGKALLDRGKLQRRVTIIPLDKITSRQVSHQTCQRAATIATSNQSVAHPAIELVAFDEEVRSAVEYVFGSTIVVDGMKAANQICDATKTRTVTLEGDVYDPSGTISGGSNDKMGTTLANLSELDDAKVQLQEKTTRLEQVNSKLAPLHSVAAKYEKLKADLELADAALQSAIKNLSQTSYGMLAEKRDAWASELESAKQEIVEMEQEQEEKWQLFEDLQTQKDELTQQREHRLAEIEQAVKNAKADAGKKTKLAREAESQSQTFELELDSLKTEVQAAADAVKAAESALQEATHEESEIQMKVGEVSAQYDEAKEALVELEKLVNNCSGELAALNREKATLVKAVEEATLEAKKLSVTINRMKKERAGAEKVVASMLKQHTWIDSEKDAFGVAGGDYDFEANDPEAASKELKKLKSETESLAKKINKKVMGMIEKAETEYTELLRKRKVVENDKKKIQAVIEELDEKKKTELERTWVKVNRDFGSIFSTLLPGAKAKIEPPEGMEAWQGLEVKVAFGDVWKESLSELSGGQRSLLALSLILSLLLFKPAPMYILDEVDAALDLSHTQNIGNMLKTHFSQSQFIVVSLKEGMFNNANVIFRTKFVDGVSTVTKTIGSNGTSRARAFLASGGGGTENNNTEEEEGESPAVKLVGRRQGGRKKGKENIVE